MKTIGKRIFILLILTAKCFASHHHHHRIFRREAETATPDYLLSVDDADDTYLCEDKICQKIKEFHVLRNFSSSCLESSISIHFEYLKNVTTPKARKTLMSGFIYMDNYDNSIRASKKITKNCRLIRR